MMSNSGNNTHIPPSPSAPTYQEDYAIGSTVGSPSAPPPPHHHHHNQHHHQEQAWSQTSPNPPSSSTPSSSSDKMIGAAAIAGGVAGLALAGPVVGIVSAVGAGALATQKNKAGDVARASGDVVLAAGDRAKKFDQKHHVVDKTKKAAGGFFKKAKEFEHKHNLGEKTGKGLTKGLQFVANKIKPKDSTR